MEPRGGWKCRRLVAGAGNCHCSRVGPGTAGQRRGSSSDGKLAPGGCALAPCRPFPTASPRRTGLPRASVSCVHPLVPQCRALAGMRWKQGSLVCSRPCRPGSVWVDLEGTGGQHWDRAPHMLTLPPFPCRAGGVCALISNARFSQAVKSTFPNVNNTLDDIHTYVASIPQARMVPLPRLGGKGPGGRSSPNNPLGKCNRGAGSRERSPPSLTPHLCPYSKLILSSTRVMSH